MWAGIVFYVTHSPVVCDKKKEETGNEGQGMIDSRVCGPDPSMLGTSFHHAPPRRSLTSNDAKQAGRDSGNASKRLRSLRIRDFRRLLVVTHSLQNGSDCATYGWVPLDLRKLTLLVGAVALEF